LIPRAKIILAGLGLSLVLALVAATYYKVSQARIAALQTKVSDLTSGLRDANAVADQRAVARQVADARVEAAEREAETYRGLREQLNQGASGDTTSIPSYLGDVLDGLR
jgi:type II secretory pathway component PulM